MVPLGELDIAVVPDPERRWYERFGVEQSALAVAHPKVIGSAIAGLFVAHSNPFRGEGGQRGLPADFLIGSGGELRAAHYGRHAADHWSVAQVIELAGGPPGASRGAEPANAARP